MNESLRPGDLIDDKYQIVRLLGEGGMGAVYEGLNVRIHRRVAIKVLHSHVAQNAEAVERFEREAQAAGRIGSSHIVEVLDLGELPRGERYLVMEYLEGQSLADRVKARGQLDGREIYPIVMQLLEGLAAAHAAGIVHRDLKPDNVYLVTSGRTGQADFVKILDFGVSKFNTLGGELSMTRTGAVVGTPYYMSPEQARGTRELDQRADLYAVGVILYECSSGRVPFTAQTFNELLFKIVLEEPPPLRDLQAEPDDRFVALVTKAMSREVDGRYQSADEFQGALSEWAREQGIESDEASRRTFPWGAARPTPPPTSPPALPHAPLSTPPGWSGPETAAPSTVRLNRLSLVGGALLGLTALGGGVAWLTTKKQDLPTARAAAENEATEPAEEKPEATVSEPVPDEVGAPKAAEHATEPSLDGADEAESSTPSDSTSAAGSTPPKRTAAPSRTPTPPTTASPPSLAPPSPPPPPVQAPPSDKATTGAGRTIRSTL